MTRTEYIAALEKELAALSSEDRSDALQYYNEYFDDAGAENEQTVIEELGSPESLGAYLVSQSSCVPETGHDSTEYNPTLRGIVVKGKQIDVQIKNGNAFKVENLTPKSTCRCGIDRSGILRIQDAEIPDDDSDDESFIKIELSFDFPFFKGKSKNGKKSSFLITVPQTLKLDIFEMHTGLGNLSVNGVQLYAQNVSIELGAGSCNLQDMFCANAKIDTGKGDVTMSGAFAGTCALETGFGNFCLRANLNGELRADTGLGNIDWRGNTDGKLKLETGKGNISFRGGVTGSLKAETGMGGIDTRLAGDSRKYAVHASSAMGSIRLEGFNGTASARGDLTYGNGPNTITLETGMGTITARAEQQ